MRRVLDEAARGVPFDEMAVLPARAAAVPRPARARVRARRRAGLLRSRHAAPGSRRPRVPRAAVVRRRRACPRGASTSISRSARCRRSATRRSAFSGRLSRRRRGVRRSRWCAPDAIGDPRSRPRTTAPGVDSDDEAVVAGTLRSPWKWEELIVESAVVGGRTRPDGKARWRRRLDGLAADFGSASRSSRRDEPESRAHRAIPARPDGTSRTCASSRCRSSTGSADWPDAGHVGRVARALRSARAARAAAARARAARRWPSCADGRRRPGRRSRKRATCCTIAWSTLDWEPPRRRYGRVFVGTPHQARGRSFRVVFVPGLAERIVPQRPREDPLLLDDAAPAARRRR